MSARQRADVRELLAAQREIDAGRRAAALGPAGEVIAALAAFAPGRSASEIEEELRARIAGAGAGAEAGEGVAGDFFAEVLLSLAVERATAGTLPQPVLSAVAAAVRGMSDKARSEPGD
ncbi:hypothetical protein [Actinoplanes sp. NPDC051851]|uniref:hypothetical protein n=1 Tax=Actinoplanes sp. NPDC051851 TaxID=3154753 RepID=UPI0034223955